MKYTTDSFIESIMKIYGDDRFSFESTVYISYSEKVIITCLKHGDFLISPSEILRHRSEGCKLCSHEKLSKLRIKNSDEFVKELQSIYGDKYDYSNIVYTGRKKKVKIKCNICGHEFEKQAYYLLNNKGCPNCVIKNRTFTTSDFIKNSKRTHGEKYDYSNVVYTNALCVVTLKCNTCGSMFDIKACHHVNSGNGCPTCAKMDSFSKSKWTDSKFNNYKFESYKLYIIRCYAVENAEQFIKIGITRNSLKSRFHINEKYTKVLPYLYEVIQIIESDDGGYIWDLEKELLRYFSKNKYFPLKEFCGMYECFDISIIEKIKKI